MLNNNNKSNNKKQNNYVSRKKPKSTPSCNCRKRDNCPKNSNCVMKNVIHKGTVSPTTTANQRVHLALAEGGWKQQYYNLTQSFTNAKHKNDTALSSYL